MRMVWPARSLRWCLFACWRRFWRRWWFITLAAVFIIGAGVFVDRYRVARVRERQQAEAALRHVREERLVELERVRKRIASDLHDDIGSSLTQISLLSEVVNQRVDRSNAAVTQPLEMIANSSRELVDSMSDIVWAINPQKDHLSDLTQRMRSLASEVFTVCGIRFRFRTPEVDFDLPVGANLRREVFLIFKEASTIQSNIQGRPRWRLSSTSITTSCICA